MNTQDVISALCPTLLKFIFSDSKTLCSLEQTSKLFELFMNENGWKIVFQLWTPKYIPTTTDVDYKEMRKVVEEHGDAVTAVCIHSHYHNPNLSNAFYEEKSIALTGSKSGRCVAFDLLTKDLLTMYGAIQSTKLIGMHPVLPIPNAFAVCSQGNMGSENTAEMLIIDSYSTKILYKQRVFTPEEQDQPLVEFFSIDSTGSYFAVAAEEILKVWQLKQHPVSLELLFSNSSTHKNGIKQLHFYGRKLITSGMDGLIKIWNMETGECFGSMNHDGLVNHIALSNRNIFCSGSSDCIVKVFDSETCTLLSALEKHSKPICSVAISSDASILISASRDKSVIFWSRVKKNKYKVVKQTKLDSCPSVIICNPWMVIIACQEGTVYFYSFKGVLLEKNKPNDSNVVSYVTDMFDQYIVFGHHDSTCSIFDFSPKKPWERGLEEEEDILKEYKQKLYDPLRQTYTAAPSKTWNNYPQEFNLQITVKHILEDTSPDVMVFKNVMSKEECDHFIKETEAIGFEACYGYHPSYRSNTRIIIEDATLAGIIFDRIKQFLPQTYTYGGSKWKLQKLNDALRFCKYIPGQHFSPHVDGHFEYDINHRSFFTFMIYLNGGFVGGNTNFLRKNKHIAEAVVPESGSLLVFPHDIYHEGARVEGGCNKYIMRSDVMFERIK